MTAENLIEQVKKLGTLSQEELETIALDMNREGFWRRQAFNLLKAENARRIANQIGTNTFESPFFRHLVITGTKNGYLIDRIAENAGEDVYLRTLLLSSGLVSAEILGKIAVNRNDDHDIRHLALNCPAIPTNSLEKVATDWSNDLDLRNVALFSSKLPEKRAAELAAKMATDVRDSWLFRLGALRHPSLPKKTRIELVKAVLSNSEESENMRQSAYVLLEKEKGRGFWQRVRSFFRI